MRFRLLSWLLPLSLLSLAAHAQVFDDMLGTVTETITDVTDVILPGITNIRLGAGPVYRPDYAGSDDYKTSVTPLVSFRYRDLLYVDNNNIRVNILGSEELFRSEHFKAGPQLKLDFGRNESDNPDLTGLGNVGTAVELGVFVSYEIERLRVRLRVRKDVAGGHSGMEAIGDIRYTLHYSEGFSLTAALSSTWSDNDYMDSYFSIDNLQALASGLPAYDAGSGLKDVRLSLGANYEINRHWSLLANAAFGSLLSDAADSPIVALRGDRNQYLGGLFLMYSF